MVRNIITDLCHHLEIGIDGNLDIGNKRVIVGTPTITLTNNILTINCDTVGASIYYTLDGSTPTSSSTKYTSAVTLNNSCTIKAIAIKGNKSSIVVSQDYTAILTAWKLMGNSTVHTDEYLTQWKVSGNSVVDNNAILSCGDLGQDGKYHVKISNGVTIYDIPLDEPLRKVGSVADSIEFVNGVGTLTRNFASALMSDMRWYNVNISSTDKYRYFSADLRGKMKDFLNNQLAVMLCPIYDVHLTSPVYNGTEIGIASNMNGIYLYDDNYDSVDDLTAFLAHINGAEFIYELATPTTEVIQVSPFPISPTDTYSSTNTTPYSAFEYKKNVEIWSCGEYNATDGKYHILVQPLGGSIVDIALDEPLRKVNNVADKIEFADGVSTLTRNLGSVDMFTLPWVLPDNGIFRSMTNTYVDSMKLQTLNLLNIRYTPATSVGALDLRIAVTNSQAIPILRVKDTNYTDVDTFIDSLQGVELIYELATPTTETIQVPQIQEADSYSCVISQGGKAVSWSSFVPNPD